VKGSSYRLSSAVAPNDERERFWKHDCVVVVRAEAANALDEHLVDGTHRARWGNTSSVTIVFLFSQVKRVKRVNLGPSSSFF